MEDVTQVASITFAFVVDGDVGVVIFVPTSETDFLYCLRNNPEIIEIDADENKHSKFNFVKNGTTYHTMDVPIIGAADRIAACFRSNPLVIEAPSSLPLRSGWTYDGVDFNPPS